MSTKIDHMYNLVGSSLQIEDIVNTNIGNIIGSFDFNNRYNETFQINNYENFSIVNVLKEEIVSAFNHDWRSNLNLNQSFILMLFIIHGLKTENEGLTKNAIRLMMYFMWNKQFNKYKLSDFDLNELEFDNRHKLSKYKNAMQVINEDLSIIVYNKFTKAILEDSINTKKLYEQSYHRVKMTVIEFTKKLNIIEQYNYVSFGKHADDVNEVINSLNKYEYSSNSEIVQCISLLNKVLSLR